MPVFGLNQRRCAGREAGAYYSGLGEGELIGGRFDLGRAIRGDNDNKVVIQ